VICQGFISCWRLPISTAVKTEARKALTVAAMLDAELFEDYAINLPEEMLTPAMKRLFRKTK
jgi:hypothetical protein